MTPVTVRVDVRGYPTWERHPRVFAAFDAMPVGSDLVVVSDHEPRPLRYEFDEQRGGAFVWEQRRLDEQLWHAVITRVPLEPVLTDLRSFLRHCATLVDISAGDLARMADEAAVRTLDPGEVLVEQGERPSGLILVRSGVVAAIASSAEGREQLLYEALPFETCAEPELFDDGATQARLVAAYGTAQVVAVPRALALGIARRSPMFALRLGARAGLRARELGERLMRVAFSSTIARIACALLPYACPAEGMVPTLPPLSRMSQSQIATIAGTVRIVAARGLAAMVREGAIELRRGRVTRVDRERLRVLCD